MLYIQILALYMYSHITILTQKSPNLATRFILQHIYIYGHIYIYIYRSNPKNGCASYACLRVQRVCCFGSLLSLTRVPLCEEKDQRCRSLEALEEIDVEVALGGSIVWF